MKKAVFTIQMFVLIALFPVYLVVELNHSTAKLPINNSSSEFTKMQEENNMQPASVSKDKGLPFLMLKTSVTN